MLNEIGLKEEAKKMKLTFSQWRQPIEGIETINVEIPSKREEVLSMYKEMIRRRKEKKRVREVKGLKYIFDVDSSDGDGSDSGENQ